MASREKINEVVVRPLQELAHQMFGAPDDDMLDRIDDAIESAMGRHEALDRDSRCTCGVRNNMDGDVLFNHRVRMVSDAVWSVLGG